MFPFRLKSEPSVTALVLDVLVLWITLPSALSAELPGWVRLIFGVVALLAAVLGVRSAVLLHRRSRLGPAVKDEGARRHQPSGSTGQSDRTPDEVEPDHPMTDVLAVWEGPLPANAEEAGETLDRMMDAEDERDDDPQARPLTPGVDAFLTDLLTHWPDTDQPGGESSPWAMSPIREGASGELCYLCLTRGPHRDRIVEHIAALATRHGLVCYDPQLDEVIS